MGWLVIGVIAFLIYRYISKHFKRPKTGNLIVVDGGVKSGKTTFSFWQAYKIYKGNLRSVKVHNFFAKLFNKVQEELPLFYSTIPVGVPYVLLTRELLRRRERFAYKSVIFVDEASLFADAAFCKDVDLNDELLLFNKLIAHETKGGTIVYNSQSISDLHHSVRRCISEHFYVHSTLKWLPFFLVVTVREERYSEDGLAINTYGEDVEDSLKRVIVSKKVWKLFDCYCYSILTDNLPVADTVISEVPDLKARKIVSFNPRHAIEVKEKKKVEDKKEDA